MLSVAICCEASEGDLRISGFGDLLGIVNTDYGVSVVDGRLDLQFHLSPVTIRIDYRSYDFGEGRYNPAGIDRFHGIKHRYAEVRLENFLIVAGHSGITFGRGLSLRSLEDRQLEYDNLVDGLLLEFSNWGFSLEAIDGDVEVKVYATDEVDYTELNLEIVVVEANVKHQGYYSKEFDFVARDLLEAEDIALSAVGDSVKVVRSFLIAEGWVPAKINVIAFVQEKQSHEFIQAGALGM